MPDNDKITEWTERFRILGASNPESWASSQVNEGINQYARFVFLRQAWNSVVRDGDRTWISQHIQEAERRPNNPGSGCGLTLKRMLAAGVSENDIIEVVRVMQWQTLEGLAYQIDDSSVAVDNSENLPEVNWTLFEVDEKGNPLRPIGGLHENVLDTDPAGKEMRPK